MTTLKNTIICLTILFISVKSFGMISSASLLLPNELEKAAQLYNPNIQNNELKNKIAFYLLRLPNGKEETKNLFVDSSAMTNCWNMLDEQENQMVEQRNAFEELFSDETRTRLNENEFLNYKINKNTFINKISIQDSTEQFFQTLESCSEELKIKIQHIKEMKYFLENACFFKFGTDMPSVQKRHADYLEASGGGQ